MCTSYVCALVCVLVCICWLQFVEVVPLTDYNAEVLHLLYDLARATNHGKQ
jgi:hypothetical protein